MSMRVNSKSYENAENRATAAGRVFARDLENYEARIQQKVRQDQCLDKAEFFTLRNTERERCIHFTTMQYSGKRGRKGSKAKKSASKKTSVAIAWFDIGGMPYSHRKIAN